MTTADRFDQKFGNWTRWEFILPSWLVLAVCRHPSAVVPQFTILCGHRLWLQNCKLAHDCRRVRSHHRHDANRLRCWQICSDLSRLLSTVGNSIHTTDATQLDSCIALVVHTGFNTTTATATVVSCCKCWCCFCFCCYYYFYTVSQKNKTPNSCPYLRQILTYFQSSFTSTLSRKFAINCLLKIPPHLKRVATLPCKN